ncbi:AraC family transcriptional regulator [Nonomuraea angiospora]|uniref:AraC-like DNA-binding protein n=1 Tax=Nonomuraea angiospora TaxID=46172 RepID=A0ABR9LXK3_9ACTN|nr:AraC family transcriptional regulator [Nonomuraea angiospora]MBE1585380.1 AraC-like DNA-binding protein [Nonomuraea angiospora]
MTARRPAGWARYLTPAPESFRLGLVCLGVGAIEGKVVSQPDRTLESYAAVLVTGGRGRLRWDGRRHDVVAPAMFWLPPGVRHAYAPDPPGWSEWWALFDGDATQVYERFGYIDLDRPVRRLHDTGALEAAFHTLARASRPDDPRSDVEAAGAMHQLIAAAYRSISAAEPAQSPVLRSLLSEAYRPVSVEDHAGRLGMSVTAFRNAVRRAAGCGPKEYVLRLRLNRAKELLVSTELPVAAIGRRVGYDDAGYFSRLFTRRTGIAPSRFRESRRRMGGAPRPWAPQP